jgi:hypothetical protein
MENSAPRNEFTLEDVEKRLEEEDKMIAEMEAKGTVFI